VTLQQDMAHNKLMMRFQRHLDEAAFGQLVSAYTGPAAAVACQILNDRALAEDAVQEAFLRVIRRRDQFIASHSFAGWFYTILRHVCIDLLRKKNRNQTLLERLNQEAEASTTDRGMSDHRSLLASLPAREKAVLELRVVHSLTFREIGVALSISEEAAKKRAQRGLCRLRETLGAGWPRQIRLGPCTK
jgi:RNA polymerase sigma-70 factor, ECF subfamily